VRGATSGIASSVAFTPLQGLEIVNPQAAEKRVQEVSVVTGVGVVTSLWWRWWVWSPVCGGGGGCGHQFVVEVVGVVTSAECSTKCGCDHQCGGGGCGHQVGMVISMWLGSGHGHQYVYVWVVFFSAL
jgi:hypothetical protein